MPVAIFAQLARHTFFRGEYGGRRPAQPIWISSDTRRDDARNTKYQI